MTKRIKDDPDYAKAIMELQPIGFVGKSEYLACCVLYPASDISRYVTGPELVNDIHVNTGLIKILLKCESGCGRNTSKKR